LTQPAASDSVAAFMAALRDGSYYEDCAPAWAALRQAGTLVKLPLGGGMWACTTWDGCADLARDPRLSAARAQRYESALPVEPREARPFGQLLSEMVLYQDPPRHTRIRKLLNRAFTPEIIARSRAGITALFDELLDDWIKRGDGEIMATLIHPFPALVIADWLGLPRSDWPLFLAWADALVQLGSACVTGGAEPEQFRWWLAAVEESRSYLDAFVTHRQPGANDLLGMLMEVEEGEILDRSQLVAQSLLILAAGRETTRNLIGGGLHWLLSHSCDFREFGDDIARRLAVDELLRLTSPVTLLSRVVAEDLEFAGASLRKGESVILAWASANRDPKRFPEPERVDLRRLNNPHLAFGAGPHACLGLHLARMEAQIAFEHLWSRLPNLRLAPQPPEWNRNLFIHGPLRLYVDYERPQKSLPEL
jgi:cytochrome P450